MTNEITVETTAATKTTTGVEPTTRFPHRCKPFSEELEGVYMIEVDAHDVVRVLLSGRYTVAHTMTVSALRKARSRARAIQREQRKICGGQVSAVLPPVHDKQWTFSTKGADLDGCRILREAEERGMRIIDVEYCGRRLTFTRGLETIRAIRTLGYNLSFHAVPCAESIGWRFDAHLGWAVVLPPAPNAGELLLRIADYNRATTVVVEGW
jgi:hypothetical protein